MYIDEGLKAWDDSDAYSWEVIAITMAHAGRPHVLTVFKFIHVK
jgi:hypothetical protein